MSDSDTITAIATPTGIGGIGIIRISGHQALSISQQLTDREIRPGIIQFAHFHDHQGQSIDHGVVLYFQSPRSFTGEDVIEIQGHGGPVVQQLLLNRICELGGRLADAGEFSRRAFENDKIDLTQAEAIADLIESGSQAAARAAMRSLQGVFSERVNELVQSLVETRVYIEAALDFAEEEIDFLAESDIQQRLDTLLLNVQSLLAEAEQGQILHDGMTLAIAGQPNAGKSSLLNYLAGYDAAIVTDIAGTTRDVIREHIALKGIPIKAMDTAGLRDSQDPVEQEGIRRAWQEIEQADVVLLLMDATRGFCEKDAAIEQRLQHANLKKVWTKTDLLPTTQQQALEGIAISTKTGQGMDQLIDLLTGGFSDFNQQQTTFMARKRHVQALKQALAHLSDASNTFKTTQSGELTAEDLRFSQQQLNQITGEFNTEDLLGAIFSGFCIGK